MQKLKFINSNEVEINFTENPFGITSWNGFDNVSLDVQSQTVPFHDGSVYLDSLLKERTISVTLAVNDEGSLSKRYELKRKLISILNPKLGEGYLVYENDYISKRIKCIPEIPKFSNKNQNDSGTLKSSLSFSCCDPYWEDLEETIKSFNLRNNIIIENNGDVPISSKMEIITTNVKNPIIKNLTLDKKIKLNGVFNNNIEIDTTFGNKKIFSNDENFKLNNIIKNITSITYSEKLNIFIAGGNNFIIRSYDGINWEIISMYVQFTLNDIIYCDKLNVFIGVGSFGTIIKSSDGINWETLKSGVNTVLKSITYSEKLNMFVIVSDRRIIYSQDLVSWSTTSSFSYDIYSVSWSDEQKIFVAVGDEYYSESSDGINWNSIENGIILHDVIYSEKFNSFIGVGESIVNLTFGKVLNSYDEKNPYLLKSIIYSEKLGLFISTGDDGVTFTSLNTVNWNRQDLDINFNDICYSNELNMIIMAGDNFVNSNDGLNWKYTSNVKFISSLTKSYIECSIYSEKLNIFIAGGNNFIIRSYDGINWEIISMYVQFTLNDIIYCDKLNVFIGVGSFGTIIKSSDGINWETLKSGVNTVLKSITYSEKLNMFIAVGNDKTIIKSSDGINWENVNTDKFDYGNYYNVAYSEKLNMFVAVGIGGNYNRMLRSEDGVNWKDISITSVSQIKGLFAIAYSEKLNMFVAVGIGGYFFGDGYSWNYKISDGFYYTNVIYSDYLELFIACGLTGIIISSDGVNFKDIQISCYLNSVAVRGRKIYIFGNVICESYTVEKNNEIDKLSEDSDIQFNLEIGKNKLMFNYDEGYASVKMKYRNKYIGV